MNIEDATDSDSDTGVEDDDVAFHHEDDHPDVVDSSIHQNEPKDDDELVVLSSASDSNTDNEENRSPLVSPSGIEWNISKAATGREHRANIFTGRRGFVPGLRRTDEKEAFLVVFHDLIETALLFTIKSGRRFASHSGGLHQWKNVEREEMLAFLGKF